MTQSNLASITEAKDAFGNTKTNISDTATKRVILRQAPASPRTSIHGVLGGQNLGTITEARDGLGSMKINVSDTAANRGILTHASASASIDIRETVGGQNLGTIVEAKDVKTDISDTATKRVILTQASTSPRQNFATIAEAKDALRNTKTEISDTAPLRVILRQGPSSPRTSIHRTVGEQNSGTITAAEDAVGYTKAEMSDTVENHGILTHASASSSIHIRGTVGGQNLGAIPEAEDALGSMKTEIRDTAAKHGMLTHASASSSNDIRGTLRRQSLGTIPEAEDAHGNTKTEIADTAAKHGMLTHASASLGNDIYETIGGQNLRRIKEAEDVLGHSDPETSRKPAKHELRHAATSSNIDMHESLPDASPKTHEHRRKGWKRSTTVNAQIFENYIEEVRESNPAAEALLTAGEERARHRSKSRSDFQVLKWREYYHWTRFKVFTLLEEPRSSNLAFWISSVMVVLVLSSLVAFVVESMPRYCPDVAPEYRRFWFRLGFLFNAAFTAEYLARFWSTSSGYSAFLLDGMNIIDIVSVLPFWTQMLPLGIKGGNTACLRVLRLLRVFRIFKLARFSVHLRIIVESFVWSSDPLILLGFFVGVGVFLYSTLLWCVERGEWTAELECFIRLGESECSPYQSIPVSMYWAVTTITTVGYGDACPITAMGKCVTCLAMISGILVIAMPLSILSNAMQRCFDAVKDEFTLEEVEEAQMVANSGCVSEDLADAEALKKLIEEIRRSKEQITQLMPNVRALVRKHAQVSGALRAETVTNLCDVVESNVSGELDLMKQLLEGCILEMHQRHPARTQLVRQLSGSD